MSQMNEDFWSPIIESSFNYIRFTRTDDTGWLDKNKGTKKRSTQLVLKKKELVNYFIAILHVVQNIVRSRTRTL